MRKNSTPLQRCEHRVWAAGGKVTLPYPCFITRQLNNKSVSSVAQTPLGKLNYSEESNTGRDAGKIDECLRDTKYREGEKNKRRDTKKGVDQDYYTAEMISRDDESKVKGG